ncbi:uncharacterized protein EV422DRAFT_535330 [Fimicolochytrium jonesii]|uniref:uncharacterized protein n=1 Tax=Fimicolochytrium jonesii TaxID=1396493 RepID=UPI0022FE2423|nr:uncharacterized protein EV422DRAFT_535330 [Fimicolochytrium jonesii]KAI8819160.1 hypothetical protein EV422DRAFT_535330 [Fimicolochytrium jonesii]
MRWPTQHPLLAGIRPLPTALLLTLLTTPTLAQRAASLPSDLTLPAGLQACTWPPQPNHPYILLSRSPSSSTSLCLASTGSGGVALSSCNGGEAAQRLTFSLVGGTTDQYRIGVESGGQGSCVASGNRFVGTGSPVQVAAHCGDAAVASRWRIGANVEENGEFE